MHTSLNGVDLKEVSLDIGGLDKRDTAECGNEQGCTADNLGGPTAGKKVQTEFVFCAEEEFSQVHICGDWSAWQPIAMNLERTRERCHSKRKKERKSFRRTWSVITPVSVGYHEFCFLADSRVTISRRHPTTANDFRNWRIVHGPRATSEVKPWLPSGTVGSGWSDSRLSRTLDRMADSLHGMLCGERLNGEGRQGHKDCSRDQDRDVESLQWKKILVGKRGIVPSGATIVARGIAVCGLISLAFVALSWICDNLT